MIGSFGSSVPFKSTLFSIELPENKAATPSQTLRYGKLPEIHHIFRDDPRSPPKLLTLLFTLSVLAAFPALLIAWVALGANVKHLPKALAAAPISHAVFYSSIIGMEFVFFMYYNSWRLFQVLPVAGVFGLIAFLSGSGALTEVQERRLKGER
jgi:oligosaccharyltransferase complex subunit delta (ribophorin II)